MQYILSMNLQGETKVQWSKLYTISFVSPCIIFLPSWKVDFGQAIRPMCIFQITSTVFHPIRFLNTNTTKLPSSILFLFLFRFLKKVIPKSTQLIFKSKFSPSLSLTTKKKIMHVIPKNQKNETVQTVDQRIVWPWDFKQHQTLLQDTCCSKHEHLVRNDILWSLSSICPPFLLQHITILIVIDVVSARVILL